MNLTPLWSPAPEIAAKSRMAQFMAEINASHQTNYQTFADLHAYSIRDTESFWAKAWDFLGITGERGDGPVLKLGERFEDARFFEGARLNYAENLLRKVDETPAIIFWGEDSVKRTMSWAELHSAVSLAQQALQAHGVGVGDRVAALMPNMPETIVGLLAASSSFSTVLGRSSRKFSSPATDITTMERRFRSERRFPRSSRKSRAW